jgi:hypothetical protein
MTTIIKAYSDVPRSGLAYGSTPPIVTALPANPQFGDVVTYIADAANGVAWTLQYDASGTYPWKFVGGSPLWAQNTTNLQTNSSTYQTTNMPTVTIPRAGDYMIEFGGYVQKVSNGPGVADMKFGLHVNGSLVADCGESNSTVNDGGNAQRIFRATGVTAAHVADVRVKTSSSLDATFQARYINVTPIRVSA